MEPNIRIKGFDGDWEQRSLGDIFSFQNGFNGGKEVYGSGIPLISVMDVLDDDFITYDKIRGKAEVSEEERERFSVNYGDVLFQRSSENVEDAGTSNVYLDQDHTAVFGGFVIRGRGISEYDPKFMKYCLSTPMVRNQFMKKAQGAQHVNISQEVLQGIRIFEPSDAEQRKISEMFSCLGQQISLQQQKVSDLKELKKYMLQKMFPKDGEKVPEIRFAGFEGEWEQRKLGDICERVTRKNKNGESDLPLTIASQYGLIDQRDFFNKVVAAKDMSNYYLLKQGEFAYNKSFSNGFDYGSIKRLNAYAQGCLSTLYICFGITSDDLESDYLECFFDTLKWYSNIAMICAEGARNHGLLNVDTKAFFEEVTIEMPSSKEEQRKISAYLNTLDSLITHHQRKHDALLEFKAYLLQNMFPKEV